MAYALAALLYLKTRTGPLLALSFALAVVPSLVLASQGWVECASGFLSPRKEITRAEGARARQQCMIGNCWALSGLTTLEQLARTTRGSAQELSSEAVAYRHLQVQTLQLLLSNDSGSAKFEEGGHFHTLLNILARFGAPTESSWKPKVSLESGVLANPRLTSFLRQRISSYRRERALILLNNRTPEARSAALQSAFERALDDCFGKIEELAGGPIPFGSGQEWLPQSVGHTRSVFQSFTADANDAPLDPSVFTAPMSARYVVKTNPVGASTASASYESAGVRVPERHAWSLRAVESPYYLATSKLHPQSLWEIAIVEVARGRAVQFEIKVSNEMGHAMVIVGAVRDPITLNPTQILYLDSNRPGKTHAMSKAVFLKKVTRITYLRDVAP